MEADGHCGGSGTAAHVKNSIRRAGMRCEQWTDAVQVHRDAINFSLDERLIGQSRTGERRLRVLFVVDIQGSGSLSDKCLEP